MTARNHFACHSCGWETKAPDHVLQVWHPCKPARTRRRLVKLPPVEASREELLAETRGQVFTSLEDALGPAAFRGGSDADD